MKNLPIAAGMKVIWHPFLLLYLAYRMFGTSFVLCSKTASEMENSKRITSPASPHNAKIPASGGIFVRVTHERIKTPQNAWIAIKTELYDVRDAAALSLYILALLTFWLVVFLQTAELQHHGRCVVIWKWCHASKSEEMGEIHAEWTILVVDKGWYPF